MATIQHKAQTVVVCKIWIHGLNSYWILMYGVRPLDKNIKRWYKQLRQTGNVETRILLSILSDWMKMLIRFGRLSCAVPRNSSPEEGQNCTCSKVSTEFFGGAYIWNYTNYRYSTRLQHVRSNLVCSFWHKWVQKFWYLIMFWVAVFTRETKFYISGHISQRNLFRVISHQEMI